jgi:DNA invertase Pin-like site-specific DNA recombinase
MEEANKPNVGIYYQLNGRSYDESHSLIVEKQKQILKEYARQQNWNVVDCYIDEGFSGLIFHRPELSSLEKAIEEGKIDIVLTSDISRIGRNLPLTLQYIQEHFLDTGVRYIAINNCIDTAHVEADFYRCLIESLSEILEEKNAISDDYEL